jgi:hypothetical protein
MADATPEGRQANIQTNEHPGIHPAGHEVDHPTILRSPLWLENDGSRRPASLARSSASLIRLA